MSSETMRQHYQERDKKGGETDFWSIYNPIVLHIAQERERIFLNMLKVSGVTVESAKVLDFGCGAGGELVSLLRYGFKKENLFGVDFSFSRVNTGKETLDMMLVNGDGAALPFADACFDVVMQNVVFSSVVDRNLRSSMALEIQRVAKNEGHLFWYDANRCRGNNPHFLPVPKTEVESLFSNYRFKWNSLTTDTGLLKKAHEWLGGWVMVALGKVPFFRTNILGIGSKHVD